MYKTYWNLLLCGIRGWTQGCVLARLCHLRHSTSNVCISYFWDILCLSLPRLWSSYLCILFMQEGGMTDVHHCVQLLVERCLANRVAVIANLSHYTWPHICILICRTSSSWLPLGGKDLCTLDHTNILRNFKKNLSQKDSKRNKKQIPDTIEILCYIIQKNNHIKKIRDSKMAARGRKQKATLL
jgi:hypothetical protein